MSISVHAFMSLLHMEIEKVSLLQNPTCVSSQSKVLLWGLSNPIHRRTQIDSLSLRKTCLESLILCWRCTNYFKVVSKFQSDSKMSCLSWIHCKCANHHYQLSPQLTHPHHHRLWEPNSTDILPQHTQEVWSYFLRFTWSMAFEQTHLALALLHSEMDGFI